MAEVKIEPIPTNNLQWRKCFLKEIQNARSRDKNDEKSGWMLDGKLVDQVWVQVRADSVHICHLFAEVISFSCPGSIHPTSDGSTLGFFFNSLSLQGTVVAPMNEDGFLLLDDRYFPTHLS